MDTESFTSAYQARYEYSKSHRPCVLRIYSSSLSCTTTSPPVCSDGIAITRVANISGAFSVLHLVSESAGTGWQHTPCVCRKMQLAHTAVACAARHGFRKRHQKHHVPQQLSLQPLVLSRVRQDYAAPIGWGSAPRSCAPSGRRMSRCLCRKALHGLHDSSLRHPDQRVEVRPFRFLDEQARVPSIYHRSRYREVAAIDVQEIVAEILLGIQPVT